MEVALGVIGAAAFTIGAISLNNNKKRPTEVLEKNISTTMDPQYMQNVPVEWYFETPNTKGIPPPLKYNGYITDPSFRQYRSEVLENSGIQPKLKDVNYVASDFRPVYQKSWWRMDRKQKLEPLEDPIWQPGETTPDDATYFDGVYDTNTVETRRHRMDNYEKKYSDTNPFGVITQDMPNEHNAGLPISTEFMHGPRVDLSRINMSAARAGITQALQTGATYFSAGSDPRRNINGLANMKDGGWATGPGQSSTENKKKQTQLLYGQLPSSVNGDRPASMNEFVGVGRDTLTTYKSRTGLTSTGVDQLGTPGIYITSHNKTPQVMARKWNPPLIAPMSEYKIKNYRSNPQTLADSMVF